MGAVARVRGEGTGNLRRALLGLALAAFTSSALAADPGELLARKVYERPDGRDNTAKAVMTLEQPGQPTRVRDLYSYRLDQGVGKVKSLIRFVSPPDVENVALLTVDGAGERDDQWIYLPAAGQVRRILGDRKGGRFVGSDIYYEDLRDRAVELDKHRLVGREPIQGVECEVLESVPTDRGNSVYSKRLSWIHPQTLIPLRVDYFEKDTKEPSKRLVVQRIEKIQGYWTVTDSTVTDLRAGHSTRLKLDRVLYDRGLHDDLFSRQTLEDPARELKHRP